MWTLFEGVGKKVPHNFALSHSVGAFDSYPNTNNRWFAVPANNPDAETLSNGLYTVHEMGHSLGLLHTFQAAAYTFQGSACTKPSYVSSSCFAETVRRARERGGKCMCVCVCVRVRVCVSV